jgi:ACT domain-containing protein
MSIKIFNEETQQWEIKATNHANMVEIEDTTGELNTEDVEGALTTLVDKIDSVEIDIYDTKKQVNRTDDKVNNVLKELQHHLDNHPSGGGGGGDWVLPTITSTFEDNTVVDKGVKVFIPIFYSSGNLGNGTAYIVVNNVEIGSQSVKQGSNNVEVGIMPSQLNTVSIYVKDRGGLLSNQLSWTVICGGIEVSTTFDFEADYPMGETLKLPFNIETQSEEKIVMYLTIDQNIYMVDC